MPISGTHSIVGATIGFSIVLRGWDSVKWKAIIRIVASWFASPILSGFISSIIYMLIAKSILNNKDPLESGLKALPLFYGFTIFINVASIVIDGPNVFGLNQIPWYIGLLISKIIAAVAITCVALLLVPRLRRRISEELKLKMSQGSPSKAGGKHLRISEPGTPGSKKGQDTPATTRQGFDNKAFKPDIQTTDTTGKSVEIQLDPSKLEKETTSKPLKPIIAPKPAHLTQQATNQPLEWIDLTPELSDSPIGQRTSSKAASKGPLMLQGERLEIFRLFSSLQILTACFASFAHGTNDVSNAVAPLIPIWNIYATGHEDITQQTPIWILAFGGIGICTGLWAWGRAVMSTVGTGLTQLTPSKGFAIELGAAVSVLCATKMGLPISTTHCKVGSVVIVGLVSSKFCSNDGASGSDVEKGNELEIVEKRAGPVDWKLFGNIAITWLITVPLAALASALVTVALRWLAL